MNAHTTDVVKMLGGLFCYKLLDTQVTYFNFREFLKTILEDQASAKTGVFFTSMSFRIKFKLFSPKKQFRRSSTEYNKH